MLMCSLRWTEPDVRRTLNVILLVAVLAHFIIAVTASAQSQDVINAVHGASLNALSDRVQALDRLDIGTRVKVLEEAMTEVKLLSRGIALAVLGQLIARIMDLRVAKGK